MEFKGKVYIVVYHAYCTMSIRLENYSRTLSTDYNSIGPISKMKFIS